MIDDKLMTRKNLRYFSARIKGIVQYTVEESLSEGTVNINATTLNGKSVKDILNHTHDMDSINGLQDALKNVDAVTVNGHTVKSDVPANAKFTDTTYTLATSTKDGLLSKEDYEKIHNGTIGTASSSTIDILTSDPISPQNGYMWIVKS